MCDCIQEIEKKFVEEQPLKGKKIIKATINKMLQFLPGRLVARPVIEMMLRIEGLKKEKVLNVAYGFCPFCGVKFDAVEENATKSGIDLIAEERQKQIDKHGFTGEHHAEHPEWYEHGQLMFAARLLAETEQGLNWTCTPNNWDETWWANLCERPFEERIVISAALIAAELDRRIALLSTSEIANPKSDIES